MGGGSSKFCVVSKAGTLHIGYESCAFWLKVDIKFLQVRCFALKQEVLPT